MNKPQLIAGVALGLLVVGGIGGWLVAKNSPMFSNGTTVQMTGLPSTSNNTSMSTAQTEPFSQSQSTSSPGVASSTQVQSVAPAPWNPTPSGVPTVAGQGIGGTGTTTGNPINPLEFQRRLAAMTANGRTPPIHELDTLLADMQRSQGSNEIAGVDIAALRENLRRADEIQKLAKEMEKLVQQPKPDMPRVQMLLAQIQQLQAGIKVDVSAKPKTK